MKTRLSHFCDRLIEAGWLLVVVLVPAFFNVRTARVFEPDKGAILRSLALVMAAAWLVKVVERAVCWLGGRLGLVELTETGRAHRDERRRGASLRTVLIVLCILYAAVYLGSTFTSVHPRISLMGSYQRGQGAYLTLCLIVISLLVATHLRTRSQLGRLLAAVALGSLPVTVYAVAQYAGADPLPWGATGPIVASTLGNSNFLAAYLVMVIPLTLAWLIILVLAAWNALQYSEEPAVAGHRALQTVGYGLPLLGGLVILGLQVYALVIADAQIAVLALMAAAVPSVLLLVAVFLRNSLHNSQRRRVALGVAGVLILGILLALTFVSFADVSLAESPLARSAESAQSPDMVVRLMIWEGARNLLYNRPAVGDQPDRWTALRPLLGYGPETMYLTYNAVYQPELGHYEARTASPDRAHNQLLDVGVNLGWAGVIVFLLLLVVSFSVALVVIARARGAVEAVVAGGALWAGLAHFVEAQFNVPIMSTRLLFWIGLGLVAALAARHENEVETVEGSRVNLFDPPLASGVALLLLPTITLVTVATVGFLRVPRDVVWPGVVMAIGLLLAVAAAVVAERIGRQQLSPVANGLLVVLAFVLLAGAGLLMGRLLSVMVEPVPEMRAIRDESALLHFLQQTTMFPVYGWLAAFAGLLSVAISLPGGHIPPAKWSRGRLVAFAVASPLYALVAAATVMLILITCVCPVQADIDFKMADPYVRNENMWRVAIGLYEAAIDLAPQEDFYYIFLGRAQLEQAQSGLYLSRREEWLAQTLETLERACSLNPLNPGHIANLARFHRQAADLEADPEAREARLQVADGYYAQAVTLAPQNVILLNEWAMLQYQLNGEEQACRMLERSLELDPEFEQTQQQFADICPQALPGQPQNLDFED